MKVLFHISAAIMIVSPLYILWQLVRISCIVTQDIACTYVALLVILPAMAIILLRKSPDWIIKRRTLESDELKGLYAEVAHYSIGTDGASNDNAASLSQAQKEMETLKKLEENGQVVEISGLPLRKALADLYHPETELVAKTRRELELLDEYIYSPEQDPGGDESERVRDLIKSLEETIDGISSAATDGDERDKLENKKTTQVQAVRAALKSLRDTVAYYDRTWAIGEVRRACVTYWVSAALVVTSLVGILPVVHSEGDWNLGILHWMVLGAAGSLLSVLLRLHNLDLPEIGEREGDQLVHGTLRSLPIGCVTAFLLYVALWGELLDGAVFPDVPTRSPGQPIADVDLGTLKDAGLSAFWGLFSGLSPIVLRTLTKLAESSLGESEGDS